MFRREEGALQLLLVKRGCQPFQGSWALPGGFVGEGETAEAAASRELAEETGLSQLPLEPLGFYDASGRDPRGWVVSQAFVARCNQGLIASAGDDATDTRWFAVRMSNQADGALKLELGSEALTLFVTFDEERGCGRFLGPLRRCNLAVSCGCRSYRTPASRPLGTS